MRRTKDKEEREMRRTKNRERQIPLTQRERLFLTWSDIFTLQLGGDIILEHLHTRLLRWHPSPKTSYNALWTSFSLCLPHQKISPPLKMT